MVADLTNPFDPDHPDWEPWGENGMIRRTGDGYVMMTRPSKEEEEAEFIAALRAMPGFDGDPATLPKGEMGRIETMRIITGPRDHTRTDTPYIPQPSKSKRKRQYGATLPPRGRK